MPRLGINSRADRNTALLQHAAELPVPVLAELLGLHTVTADRWAQAASAGWTTYVAIRSPNSARANDLLATTNARPMEMKGRAIQGWLHVDGDDLRTEHQLTQWIAIGTATARSAPTKRPNR